MTDTKNPLVSITCLSWNDQKTICQSVNSAIKQDYPNLEIIIIDNSSNDGTSEKLKEKIPLWEKELPGRIKFIKNTENKGFAPGQNQAILASSGDFILCLNSDAILKNDYVAQAVKFLNTHPAAGALQGKLLRYDFEKNDLRKHPNQPSANIIDTTGLVILKNRRVISRGQGEADLSQFEEIKEVFGADGAAPVYRQTALEDIKLPISNNHQSTYKNEYFDEDFFLYKEDVDLAWRLRLAGWKTFCLPSAVAYHGRGAGDSAAKSFKKIIRERRKINSRAKYYSFKNQRLMQIKNELSLLFLRHLPQFLLKEIGAWAYVLAFEPFTVKVTKELFRQMPLALKKRKIIMAKRRASAKEMLRWFN